MTDQDILNAINGAVAEVPPATRQEIAQAAISDIEGVFSRMTEATVQWVIKWAAVCVFVVVLSAALCMEAVVLRDGNTPLVQDMTDKLDWLVTIGFGALVTLVTGKTIQHVMITKKQGA